MRRNFIIAGQSNADGAGKLSEVPVYANASRIFVYGKNGVWNQNGEPIGNSAGAIDKVSLSLPAAAGFGMSFANRLCTLFPNDQVGLIPCALGGTLMKLWRKLNSRSYLYGSMLARATESEAAGTLSGLLWWQGESDATTSAETSLYFDRFNAFISNIRMDLGNPNLPVAYARLNNLAHPERPYWTKVRAFQQGTYFRKGVMVSTDGVPYQSDRTHCTTSGYVTIGIRFADAIYPLL